MSRLQPLGILGGGGGGGQASLVTGHCLWEGGGHRNEMFSGLNILSIQPELLFENTIVHNVKRHRAVNVGLIYQTVTEISHSFDIFYS